MDLQSIDLALQNTDQAELDHFADLIARSMKLTIPITKMELILTEDCTFRCDYCFIEGKNSAGHMDSATAQAATEFLLRESSEKKNLDITLFGGEPLLQFSLIKEIVAYNKRRSLEVDKGISYAITTNGCLVDHEKMQFFKDNSIKLLLSIDGNRSTHDLHRKLPSGEPTFDLIFTKIALMKEYQPWLGVRLTVNPDTARDLASNIKFLHAAGANQFIIGPNILTIWGQEDVDAYADQQKLIAEYYIAQLRSGSMPIRITEYERGIEQIRHDTERAWGCEAARDKVSVSAKGLLFPCSKFNGLDGLQGAYCLGDVWKGITNHIARAEVCDNRRIVRGSCVSCEYGAFCTGGCPAENLANNKSIFVASSASCALNKIRIDLHRQMPELSLAHTRLAEQHIQPLPSYPPFNHLQRLEE